MVLKIGRMVLKTPGRSMSALVESAFAGPD
jgi:hypothetical protein